VQTACKAVSVELGSALAELLAGAQTANTVRADVTADVLRMSARRVFGSFGFKASHQTSDARSVRRHPEREIVPALWRLLSAFERQMSLPLGCPADASVYDSLDWVTECADLGVSCFGDGDGRRAAPRPSAQGQTDA
jgi:hypothetical protein